MVGGYSHHIGPFVGAIPGQSHPCALPCMMPASTYAPQCEHFQSTDKDRPDMVEKRDTPGSDVVESWCWDDGCISVFSLLFKQIFKHRYVPQDARYYAP